MKKKTAAYLEMTAIAALVVLIDQWTKYLVRTNLMLRETWMPWEWLEPYFRIVHWKNTGVAFGLFQGNGWIFTIIGLIVVVMIVIFYSQITEGSALCRAALSLELGGAIGNLLDRINPDLGYVVDFLWFGNFPVFNIADAAIVIGAFLLLIYMWQQERLEAAAKAAAPEESEAPAEEPETDEAGPAEESEEDHE